MLAQEGEGALACKLRRFRVVAGPILTVEAVAGVIPKDLHLGMQLLHAINILFRDVPVLRTEVQHHRAARPLFGKTRDISAVVSNRSIDLQARRRQPCGGPTKTIPNNTAFAPGWLPKISQSCRDVLHGISQIDLPR